MKRLDQILPLLRRYEKAKNVVPKSTSQMSADDAATAPVYLSHFVGHCLDLAADNLRGVRALTLTSDGEMRLHQFSHYPLIRGVLEASSHARWVLLPDELSERVRRLLVSRSSEERYNWKFAKDIVEGYRGVPGKDPKLLDKDDRKAQSIYGKSMRSIVGKAHGFSEKEVQRPVPSYAVIVREASDSLNENDFWGATIWSLVSGLTHPSTSRLTHFSKLEVVRDSAQVVNARLTTDVSWFNLTLMASMTAFLHAVEILELRVLQPAAR